MAPEAYRTLAGDGRAEQVVRGSTFVAYARPASSVESAERFVADVAEAQADATHVVPAYRVRTDPPTEYADDAGEPSGTAGDPALAVLRRREVENCVAVVARYYGGTDLGVGGLARAYADAVGAAVEDAGVRTARPRTEFAVRVAYEDSGTVRSVLESAGADFSARYRARVTFEVHVPAAEAAVLRERLASATSGRARIEDVS